MVTSILMSAQPSFPPKPEPARFYNNFSKQFPNFVTVSQSETLEKALQLYADTTSIQIAIVIVDDLHGLTAAQYATELGNRWGVGQKGQNNGIIILIKPTGNENEREVFIAVGYGLEGKVPDLATQRIIQNTIIPYFSDERYFEGIFYACAEITARINGSYVESQNEATSASGNDYPIQDNQYGILVPQGLHSKAPEVIYIVYVFMVIALLNLLYCWKNYTEDEYIVTDEQTESEPKKQSNNGPGKKIVKAMLTRTQIRFLLLKRLFGWLYFIGFLFLFNFVWPLAIFIALILAFIIFGVLLKYVGIKKYLIPRMYLESQSSGSGFSSGGSYSGGSSSSGGSSFGGGSFGGGGSGGRW